MPPNIKKALGIVLLLLCINGSLGNKCPERCKCQPTQIDCAEKLLAKVPENIPQVITDLNLSGNNIEEIMWNSFGKLESLQYLYLNENMISHIDEKAFGALTNLQYLDLSYNFLEKVHPKIIINNLHIQQLNLYGNDFWDGTPKLVSNSLEILDLSLCNIQNFTKKNIKGLPNLQVLFLHANYLTSIDVRIFQNYNIKNVSLGYNLWKCDTGNKRMLEYLKEKNINTSDISLPCCT